MSVSRTDRIVKDIETVLEGLSDALQKNVVASAIKAGVPRRMPEVARLLKTVKATPVDLASESVAILINSYYTYIEAGRKAGGKMPPEAPILEWMVRYGVAPGKEKQVIWAIRRAIAIRGIRAKPFIADALKATSVEASAALGKAIKFQLDNLNAP
jgi:hypothetical protein